MQKDMHYFGVYALARAAGMRDDAAEIVATASEYVDDAIWDKEVFLEDGRSILAELTAHKLLNLKNADAEDQRKVWLPFHFLPGGRGSHHHGAAGLPDGQSPGQSTGSTRPPGCIAPMC